MGGNTMLEVVTTAAVGANIGPDPTGNHLGLSGMLDISAEASLSGLQVVQVEKETLTHSFFTLETLERRMRDQSAVREGVLP